MIWSANNFLARFKITPLILLTLAGCTDLSLFVVNRLAALSDYSAIENLPYGSDKLQHLSAYKSKNNFRMQKNETPESFFGQRRALGLLREGAV